MGAFIAKQPNGRYIRFSGIVDCPTNWNMTEEDYIKLCEERAREEALDILKHHLRPFDEVRKYFTTNNMTRKEFNKILKECKEPIYEK